MVYAAKSDPLGHTEDTEWKSDKDNHWHTCTVAGCDVIIETSKAAHTPDHSEPTYDDAVKCAICGYVITPALSNPTDPVESTDPSTPEEPSKPTESNPDTVTSNSPQTGDSSMMAL